MKASNVTRRGVARAAVPVASRPVRRAVAGSNLLKQVYGAPVVGSTPFILNGAAGLRSQVVRKGKQESR
jgi:hypothetical protein